MAGSGDGVYRPPVRPASDPFGPGGHSGREPGPSEIARRLGIGRSSAYRVLGSAE
jgi:hypothetical protein